MERLRRKFETAKKLLPPPILHAAAKATSIGVIHYGSTSAAMDEATSLLADTGIHVDTLRVRAFPFSDDVMNFIEAHDTMFVVEQNESAQLRALLVNEGEIAPKKLQRVLHYDGTPITARFIADQISAALADLKISPLRQKVA